MIDKAQHTNGEHYYLSTACFHGRHSYCVAPTVSRDGDWKVVGPSYSSERDEPKKPAQCKFCPAVCICRCHHEDAVRQSLAEPAPVSYDAYKGERGPGE